jgi:hypothetical protein
MGREPLLSQFSARIAAFLILRLAMPVNARPHSPKNARWLCDHESLNALLFALLAIDLGMGGAARDLARSVAAAAAHDPVLLSVRNLSTLGPADAAAIRREFESELRARGVRLVDAAPADEIRLTVSENLTNFLMVAEFRRGDERQVLLNSWPRIPPSPQPGGNGGAHSGTLPQVTLEKKLLWEQEQPILDAVRLDDGILLLDTARVLLVRGQERQSVPIPPLHAWPRDMRGRLLASGTVFTAWLPGVVCSGTAQPQLSAECHESQEPWPIAPGAIAVFSTARNFFEGRVAIGSWGAHELPPFYSAAPAGDAWVFAGDGGRARIYTRSWEPGGAIDHWGADLAGVQTPCGPRILATRPTGIAEPDAIQPFELVEGMAKTAGPAQEFPGPITALWAAGSLATAVSRDLQTGRYAAYSLAPACGS